MANQRIPGFGFPQRPDAPPGGLGFSSPPLGQGPVNQGIPPGSPSPAQAFAPHGPYPAGHLPGGASPPRPPTGPPPLGFGQYPPPGNARPPRLPYGAQNDAAPPQPTLFGLATPSSGVGFQPPSGACLQGGREPRPPTTRLGSPQTQKESYEQGRQSPQGRLSPQAPLGLNANRMPGPYEIGMGSARSDKTQHGSGRSSPISVWQNPNPGNIQASSGRSSPIPTWQNPNPGRVQTNSGRLSPLPTWQDSIPGAGFGMPAKPIPTRGRAEDGGARPANASRGTLQPGCPQPERPGASSWSADAGATAPALRPMGLAGRQSTNMYGESSVHPPGHRPNPQQPNLGSQVLQRPYAPPLGFPAGYDTNYGQKDVKSGSGQRGFAGPFSASKPSAPGSRTASTGRFPESQITRPVPAGSARVISEEKLIASFLKPREQKSLERARSSSCPPRRKAEGQELLKAMEEFDALLAPYYGGGTATAHRK